MLTAIHILLLLLALPAGFAAVYLALATLLSARAPPPPRSTGKTKFDILVPAHNEAAVIARTVSSLAAIDWPKDHYRILTIADNCTDDTAAQARAAGAICLERRNPKERGKGYALDFGFAASRADGFASAVVVIDADAQVSANILEAFAARLERGEQAVQVHYGVLNPMASWRTRLITIAKASFHIVRSRARERIGVSCGIRGNGWCVTHQLLRAVPYRAFSLTEDLEYGIDLGLAGYRVAYADEAHSDAEMVSGEQVARNQRQRWERGRFQLVRSKTLPLLAASVRKGSLVCLDLAADLLVLPLSYIALNIALLLGLGLAAAIWFGASAAWAWLGVACALSVAVYVLRGWLLSGIGARGLLDLCRAPGFLVWKLLLMLRHRSSAEWVRTERERP
jgi:cellulose synthase/poly-beta-1,6-N-acetylglucosamine synthase-like glycosyltransferase